MEAITLPQPTLVSKRLPKSDKLAWIVPLVFFGLLTIFFTYPTVLHFTSAVSGIETADRLQNLWNFWWISKAITHGQNPYLTDALFFPYYQAPLKPLPLYFHDLQLFSGIVTLPLQLLGGVVAAYNGVVLLATFVSGLATYWLIRRLGGSTIAAGLGGAIYACSPTRLLAIRQSITNIQSTEFLPLFALCLLVARNDKAGETRFWRSLNLPMFIGAILTVTACVYTDWYNTIYVLFYALFYFSWRVLRLPFSIRRFWLELRFMLLLGAGIFVLVSPLLLPSIANLNDPEFVLTFGYDREVKGSANMLSLIISGTVGLGYVTICLASVSIFSLLRPRADTGWLSRSVYWYWLALTSSATLLALGPELQISDTFNTGLLLPYALFRLLPVVSVTHVPGRFVILAMLGLAVLAAFAVDWLGTWSLPHRWLHFAATSKRQRLFSLGSGLLALIILIGTTWSPLALFPVNFNPVLQSLKNEATALNYHFLELPITRHYNHDQVRMFNQIAHEQPIIGGYLSRPVVDPYRIPDSPFNTIANLTIHSVKRQPQDIVPIYSSAQDLDDLTWLYNFRYVLLYRNEYDDPVQGRAIENFLTEHYSPQQIIYSDPDLIIYQVPGDVAAKVSPLRLELGSGWYAREQFNKTQWRWTSASSLLYATASTAQRATLKLSLSAYAKERTLQVKLNGEAIYQIKVPNVSPTNLSFELNLPPGRNILNLISLEGDQNPPQASTDSPDSRRLAFQVFELQLNCIGCKP